MIGLMLLVLGFSYSPWESQGQNLYLSSGKDNDLALHIVGKALCQDMRLC